MRKLVFVAFMLSILYVGAKEPFTVKVTEGSDNPEIENLLSLLEASQATATIFADSIDARFYAIWMVNCSGDSTRRSLAGYVPVRPDSTRIFIAAMAKDSLTVQINVGKSSRQKVVIPTSAHSLIGCGNVRTYHEVDTIPLMAYTTGIPMKQRLGEGRVVDAFYVCGVRDSKEHPSRWKELYKLPDFLYFEAIPVKQIVY